MSAATVIRKPNIHVPDEKAARFRQRLPDLKRAAESGDRDAVLNHAEALINAPYCHNCAFLERQHCQCRAYPPTVNPADGSAMWPKVKPQSDYCACWRPA
jgi:hypothetical protein